MCASGDVGFRPICRETEVLTGALSRTCRRSAARILSRTSGRRLARVFTLGREDGDSVGADLGDEHRVARVYEVLIGRSEARWIVRRAPSIAA